MRLFYVRHGQSINNHMYIKNQSYFGRVADPEITEKGYRQMQHTAQYLNKVLDLINFSEKKESIKKNNSYLYCSLLERSIQSGEIVSKIMGLPLVANEHIHENGGFFDYYEETDERIGRAGPSKKEILERHPSLVLSDDGNVEGWWGKSFEDAAQSRARAKIVLAEVLLKHPEQNDNVIWISHEDFYNTFMQVLLGIERDDVWFKLNNGALTQIEFNKYGFTFIYENYYGFLPEDLIT